MTTHLVTITVAAAILLGASGNEPAWNKVQDEDGVVVWTRPKAGSDFVQMRAETTMALPAARVWAVLRLPERFAEFMPYAVKTRLLSESAGHKVVYLITDPPIVSRRDIAIAYTLQADEKSGVYAMAFHEANDRALALPSGVVRMVSMRGRWTVKALDAGHCRVGYVLHSEPGGMVPAWIANSRGYAELPDVLVRLRQRAKKGP